MYCARDVTVDHTVCVLIKERVCNLSGITKQTHETIKHADAANARALQFGLSATQHAW